jgi:DeoR/GlpR family transcriptional regulator of sugar metabolism
MPKLTPDLAEAYARKTPKTVSRDLNALLDMKLLERSAEGYTAAKDRVLAFLPLRKNSLERPQQKAKISKPARETIASQTEA